MPIYEYECPKCGVIEVTQRITEDALTKCPECKRCKVKKLISNTSFQLKGSGWYVTDYGGKKTDDAGAAGGSSAAGESKSDSSSDSKSDSKSDSSGDSSSAKSTPKKKKESKKAKAA